MVSFLVIRCGEDQAYRKLHRSTLTQIISLREGSRRIEFETTVDWQESHKLLEHLSL